MPPGRFPLTDTMVMRGRIFGLVVLGVAWATGACDRSATDPGAIEYRIAERSGNGQFALPGEEIAEPLTVEVTEAGSGRAAQGRPLNWEVVEGAGAKFVRFSSTSNSQGIATASLRLGQDAGSYRVRVSVEGSSAPPVEFQLHAVNRPAVTAVHPDRPTAGDTIVIEGVGLPEPSWPGEVVFAGIPGTVVSREPSRIRVVVPRCLPSRTVDVEVRIGRAVSSEPLSLEVVGTASPPVDLELGEVVTLASPDEYDCLILSGDPGRIYIAILQNTSRAPRGELEYRWTGMLGGAVPAIAQLHDIAAPEPTRHFGGRASELNSLQDPADREARELLASARTFAAPARTGPVPVASPAEAWERRIRRLEMRLPSHGFADEPDGGPEVLAARVAASPPAIGTRRDFNVFNKDQKFTKITAEVRYVSDHAIFYVDRTAPENGLREEDFEEFGRIFDDPIHRTLVDIFGEPSDVDGNGRVIILFTPVINELTPRGSQGGVVAGYFYGCDLYKKSTCPESNEAEVFYSLLPDAEGAFGNPRPLSEILRIVPPVLAHEYQHMIHFNQRVLLGGGAQEDLWLSEALAHMAEDRIHAVLSERGDGTAARRFRTSNQGRALRYTANTSRTSLIGDEPPGSLEERGAQWLFLRYLFGHHGGDELLRTLTRSTLPGVRNIEAATGREWGELFTAWTASLWADPLARRGMPFDPIFTYSGTDLLTLLLDRPSGTHPLQPTPLEYRDLSERIRLPASSAWFVVLRTPGEGGPPLHLSATVEAPFGVGEEPSASLTILRYQ